MAFIHCDFRSDVLALSCSMCVILPQATAVQRKTISARRRKYPTLYLLHGLSDDHTIWSRRTSIERYAEALNLAVVMPMVHRSFYADMAGGWRYWTFLSEELPSIARSLFPLSDARADNFVAGLSMGGYGAFKAALTHPQRFAAAASLSGALDIARLCAEKPRRQEMRNIFGNLRRVAGSEHDLFHLARKAVKKGAKIPALYQWCGTEDFLHADNLHFRTFAEKLGLPLTYEEGPGGHAWNWWDAQIQRVLQWLPLRQRPK